MKRNIAIIEGSERKVGNTSTLVESLVKHCKDFDISVSIYSLLDYKIEYFDYDHKNRDDDFLKIFENLRECTNIVFATPIYWYSMSARLKTFFDRTTDLISIRKDLGRSLKGKSTWLITSGTDPNLPEGFEIPFSKTSEYFEMEYRGCLFWPVLGKDDKAKLPRQIDELMQNFVSELSMSF